MNRAAGVMMAVALWLLSLLDASRLPLYQSAGWFQALASFVLGAAACQLYLWWAA